MSRGDVEVVRGVIDGWLRGDPATLELISDDVVYGSPPTMPDRRPARGHEGVLQWVVDWGQDGPTMSSTFCGTATSGIR